MLLLLKGLGKFLKLLNSETAPSQIAAGVAFGMIVGFSPFFTWHNLLVFLLVCLLRVNLSMFFLATAIFSFFGFFLDPAFDALGYRVLVNVEGLRSLWIWVASAPILPFFRFNNTVVMGSLVLSLALFFPVFVGGILAIRKYRQKWRDQIKSSRFLKALKATKVYDFYLKFESFRDKYERLV